MSVRSSGSRLVAASLVIAAVSADADTGGLPPRECVSMMREARIARLHDNPAGELEKLQAAYQECPDEIATIYSLLSYYRRQPELEESFQEFQSLLIGRLEDPAQELPISIVEFLVRNPKAKDEELEPVLERVTRQVAESDSPDPAWMRIQARLQLRLEQFEAATLTLERLWQEEGEQQDLFFTLVNLYRYQERWQEAADLLATRVEEEPLLRSPYLDLLGKLGRFDDLMTQVRLLAYEGEDSAPPDIEGLIAGIDFEEFRGLDGLLANVAWDLRDRGQDAEAEKIFRALLARQDDSPALQAIVLNLYSSDEERQQQAAQMEQAWQEETDPNILFEQGTQRLTGGDAAGAIDLLRRAAPGLPDLEAAWYNLGMAAYRLEDWDTVESAFGRSAELNPERAQSFFFRGLALEKLGRCGEAVTALESSLKLDPERALAHYYLARCYGALGNSDAAAAALARYEALKKN